MFDAVGDDETAQEEEDEIVAVRVGELGGRQDAKGGKDDEGKECGGGEGDGFKDPEDGHGQGEARSSTTIGCEFGRAGDQHQKEECQGCGEEADPCSPCWLWV